jgi:hypothetical protein
MQWGMVADKFVRSQIRYGAIAVRVTHPPDVPWPGSVAWAKRVSPLMIDQPVAEA